MEFLEANTVKTCRNCGEPLPSDANFCHKCSQKYSDGKVTLREVWYDFIESFLNFDAKIFRTLGALFSPGKLTIEYFKGKHINYLLPVRIFLIMAVVHFTILSFSGFDGINFNFQKEQDQLREAIHQADFLAQLDSAQQKVIEKNFKGNATVSRAMDSLRHQFKEAELDTFNFGYFDFHRNFTIKPTELNIAERDIYAPFDTVVQKYHINGFFEKIQVRQSLRLFTESSNFSGFVIGKLIWMVLLMMPALALVLKLLYIRRSKYFVEHLVFSFHYHAFAFLIFSVAILLNNTGWFSAKDSEDGGLPLVLGFVAIIIYLFIAMRRVYQQGFWKTFIKYMILNFSYLIIFTVFLVATLIVSVLIF